MVDFYNDLALLPVYLSPPPTFSVYVKYKTLAISLDVRSACVDATILNMCLI